MNGYKMGDEGGNGLNLYGIVATSAELEKKGSHGSDISYSRVRDDTAPETLIWAQNPTSSIFACKLICAMPFQDISKQGIYRSDPPFVEWADPTRHRRERREQELHAPPCTDSRHRRGR